MIGSPRSIVLYSKCSHLLRCLVRCKLHKFCFLSLVISLYCVWLCMWLIKFDLISFWFDSNLILFFFFFYSVVHLGITFVTKVSPNIPLQDKKKRHEFFFLRLRVQTEKEKIGFKRTMQKKKKNLLLFTSCFKN